MVRTLSIHGVLWLPCKVKGSWDQVVGPCSCQALSSSCLQWMRLETCKELGGWLSGLGDGCSLSS